MPTPHGTTSKQWIAQRRHDDYHHHTTGRYYRHTEYQSRNHTLFVYTLPRRSNDAPTHVNNYFTTPMAYAIHTLARISHAQATRKCIKFGSESLAVFFVFLVLLCIFSGFFVKLTHHWQRQQQRQRQQQQERQRQQQQRQQRWHRLDWHELLDGTGWMAQAGWHRLDGTAGQAGNDGTGWMAQAGDRCC